MKISELVDKHRWLGWLLFLGTALIVFLLGIFASTIIQRRTEATVMNVPLYALDKFEPRNDIWGMAYPREYARYKEMADTSFSSKYNGNVFRDALDENPRLVILFGGYAFARDYNQPRGHIYAVRDVHHTLRTGTPDEHTHDMQSSSCWTCKSPDVPRVINEIGAAEFFKTPWSQMLSEIVNPIGCANCHNPENQQLRIVQEPLVEAYERLNTDLSQVPVNTMRTMVCAQCHVEYYFKGEGKYVTFPWDKGFSVEAMEAYYDAYNFYDWIHPLSKTPVIKAQHPDYELFMTGIHYERGVSCADCHMPYITEGSQKLTDHKIQSPLNNIENSCMVCHRENKDVLIKNVYDRQDKVHEQKIQLEDILVKAHIEAAFAMEKGVSEKDMKQVRSFIRQAQWRWDFVAASHGASFHSPLESMRILSAGKEQASEARRQITRALAKVGYFDDVPMPDISTKEKAQRYLGLDPVKLHEEKKVWIAEELPKWLEIAKERESRMKTPDRIR